MADYTTIDDPSEHCKGLNWTGSLDATKRSYGGNAESYVPDIYFVKNMASSSHGEHTDSVATGGFTTAYEQASYGRRGMQTITKAYTDGWAAGYDGQGNGNGNDMFALTWNCGSTTAIESYYPSGNGYGNNRTSVNASGSALAHYYTVNSTAKQSVVFYEGTGSSGAEVPHHLGVKPTFAMFRKMGEGTFDQTNYYDGGPFSFYKDMREDGATDGDEGGYHGSGWYYAPSLEGPASDRWWSAAPDSTKFTLGTNGNTNTDDYDYICYSFSDVQGYFKTGFYEGNGSADGPFVTTGFEPEMILINAQDNGTIPATHGNLGHADLDYYGGWYWFINGNTTNGFNPHDKTWNMPNSNAMNVYDQDALDIYSNGFKIRAPGGDESGGWQGGNQNDKTVWYAAWAKHPFVTSSGVVATAR